MSDDIVFIKDINDYNEFNKIKPVKKKLNTKIKFICSDCGNESIKCYKLLKIPFLCKYCQNKQAQLNPVVKRKKEKTNLIKYGVVNCFQSEEKKQKIKKTCQDRYGVDNPGKNDLVKNKRKETCLNLYGYDFPAKVPEIKEKMKNTCLNRYGVDNYSKTEESKERHKLTCMQRYGVDNYAKTQECQDKINKTILERYGRDGLKMSYAEEQLYNYIKLLYNKIIIRNNRDILKGRELDIYLPDIMLAFEYDGTYWHADPRFYKENDIINKILVKNIWKRDKEKDILCENLNIQLIRVKEYDWINNNEYEKLRIKEIIENKLLFKNNY